MTEKKDFRFNYKKYQTKHINIRILDNAMETFLNVGTSKLATIMAAIKLILFFYYLAARKSIIEETMLLAKQSYESGRVNSNDDDIINDDLD